MRAITPCKAVAGMYLERYKRVQINPFLHLALNHLLSTYQLRNLPILSFLKQQQQTHHMPKAKPRKMKLLANNAGLKNSQIISAADQTQPKKECKIPIKYAHLLDLTLGSTMNTQKPDYTGNNIKESRLQ